MNDLTPAPEDKFSFGLWTVQYPGRDPFGEPTRPPMDPVRAVREARRDRRLRHQLPRRRRGPLRHRRRRARPDPRRLPQGAGRHRPGRHHRDHQPVHPPGLQGRRLHLQPPRGTPVRAEEGHAQHRPGRRARRQGLRRLGRPRGRRVRRRPRTCTVALDRYQEAFNLLGEFVTDRGYDLQVRHRAQAQRAARRHPAADRRPRAGLHRAPSTGPSWSASTPRSGTRRWPA